MSPLKSRLRAGDVAIGTFLGLGSALAAEICAQAGLDWLLVDLEHGSGGEDALIVQLLAAQAHGVEVIVRIDDANRIRAGRALDAGAAGVMVPRLETVSEVAAMSGHLHYPPRGDRGVASYNRARQFSFDARTAAEVDDDVINVIQVEKLPLLEAIADVAALPAVDALFVGPGDLSAALGIPGQLNDRRYEEALEAVLTHAHRHGVAAGILAGSPEQAVRYINRGFRLVAIGSDSTILANGVRNTVGAVRNAI